MNFEAFSNRLTKNYRHIGKWARRQNITCFRVYDNDMPEFPLAIDRYEHIAHVAEYARPHGLSPDEHVAWLDGCLAVVAQVLDIQAENIFLKYRQRQEGLRQYEKFARRGVEIEVQENGLKFIVNPSDYLDTGLFLDHRSTRQMVRDMAAGKKVLNLFAYTGAFTVYAAAGGAAETLTLDLSNTYLKWAWKNLKINDLAGPTNRFLQTDVLEWLHERPDELYDIVVCDPPTFSNSKRMHGTLDIQRDHAWLLARVLERTAPGGSVFFSTNFRKFKLDTNSIQGAEIRDITRQTIPEDFRRNERIHHCFLITV